MGDFIDDTHQQKEGGSFYRHLEPEKFPNQTRSPEEAVYEDNDSFFGTEGTQPELYNPTDREFVTFDKFKEFENSVKKFKKTLKYFSDSDNSFFDAIIYGISLKEKCWKKARQKEFWGLVFTMNYLKLKMTLNLTGQFLDILILVLK